MSIFPLPQFEADLDDQRHADIIAYKKLKPPTSMVLRFGSMKLIGEFPYSGDAKPGCGSKIVATTHRGTEIGEMLTSTCPNAGCSKSVTRKQMLEYIDRSGGKDYPFFSKGRVERVATVEDLQAFDRLREQASGWRTRAQQLASEHQLDLKVVEVEPILGNELITVYYLSEDRIDFRDLVKQLGSEFGSRIEMRQIGARDEARLVADYEKCGQHCCCKQFLKVLKPVSMRSAKIQKATLDPLKISGRCGRLMCCLRYEDQTYDDLRKNLPHRKSRVGTPHGPGEVRDSQILTQLVLVSLDHNREQVAVPIEELISIEESEKLLAEATRHTPDPMRGMSEQQVATREADRQSDPAKDPQARHRERSQREQSKEESQPAAKPRRRRRPGKLSKGQTGAADQADPAAPSEADSEQSGRSKRKPRNRRGGKRWSPPDLRDRQSSDQSKPSSGDPSSRGTADGSGPPSGETRPKQGSGGPKRRRRRRPKGDSGGGSEGGSSNPPSGSGE